MTRYSSDTLPIVIWGASGHARVVADVVRQEGLFEIFGFLDDVHPERRGETYCDTIVLGGQEQLDYLRQQGVNHIILGFGNCERRLSLTRTLQQMEYQLGKAIHPQSVIADDVEIGDGTVVVAGAVVNVAAKIGQSVIINTHASVDHDCIISDGAHIGPGVHLGGGTRVGQGTWIGIGATVKDKIIIGSGAIIGAGAVVINDLPDGIVAYGVPAEIVGMASEQNVQT